MWTFVSSSSTRSPASTASATTSAAWTWTSPPSRSRTGTASCGGTAARCTGSRPRPRTARPRSLQLLIIQTLTAATCPRAAGRGDQTTHRIHNAIFGFSVSKLSLLFSSQQTSKTDTETTSDEIESFAGTYLEFLETRIQITTFLTMWRRMPIDVLHPAFRYISGNHYIYYIYIYKIKDKDCS